MADFRSAQTLTIANGGTTSPTLDLIETRSKVVAGILIVSPGTLPETVNIQVTTDLSASPVVWGTLQSGGADIALPAAKATQITETTAAAVRLVSTAPVAADRVFSIRGNSRA